MLRQVDEDVEALAAAARQIPAAEAPELYAQGAPADDLYVVIDGLVEVITDGQKVAEIGRGGWFGELAILHREPRRSTVRPAASSVLLRVDSPRFVRLAEEEQSTV